jgi:hypothetical protein
LPIKDWYVAQDTVVVIRTGLRVMNGGCAAAGLAWGSHDEVISSISG